MKKLISIIVLCFTIVSCGNKAVQLDSREAWVRDSLVMVKGSGPLTRTIYDGQIPNLTEDKFFPSLKTSLYSYQKAMEGVYEQEMSFFNPGGSKKEPVVTYGKWKRVSGDNRDTLKLNEYGSRKSTSYLIYNTGHINMLDENGKEGTSGQNHMFILKEDKVRVE